jgi:hypothetical protein
VITVEDFARIAEGLSVPLAEEGRQGPSRDPGTTR